MELMTHGSASDRVYNTDWATALGPTSLKALFSTNKFSIFLTSLSSQLVCRLAQVFSDLNSKLSRH